MLARLTALCALVVAFSAGPLVAQNLFILPGPNATNGNVQALTANPLSQYRVFAAGTGTFALLPNLTASEFYTVAHSTADSVLEFNSTLLDPSVLADLSTSATQAVMTPDGKLLAVSAGLVHLFSTASNTEVVPGGISQGIGITTTGIASSLDSSAIFALGLQSNGAGILSAISTSSYTVTASLVLAQAATAVSVAPNGLVYVSLPDEILEINPQTLEPTPVGGIAVTGTPGPLVFTPDGQFAVATNQSISGNTLLIASLPTHTSTDPALGLLELTSLQVTGTDTVLAISSQGAYQIALSPLAVTNINLPSTSVGGVLAAATTNDVPAGAHSTVQQVFLLTATDVFELAPSSNSVVAQYQLATNVTPGLITYAVPAATAPLSQPVTLLSYGNNQTVLPSTTSEPLVVQVLDANNLPISGYGVSFQISGSGASLYTTSAITGSNGYALTYVDTSATTGPLTVTATAGSLTTTFSLNVSTTTTTNTGPTLTIIAGQGQLMATETSTANGPGYGSSLEVLAADTNGNPIANLPVTFTVPASEGTLQVDGGGSYTQTVNTNASGIASVDFETTLLPDNDVQGYLQTQVTASAATTNPVTFYITTVPLSPSPSVYFLAPNPGTPLTGAEGTILPAAVKAQVISAVGFPIPNVALTLNDGGANPSIYPTASCNAPGGLVFTDTNGLVSCDVVFGPRTGTGTFTAVLGVTHFSNPTSFTVTTGAPTTIQITQGNNQIGGPGQSLPQALVVHVTDSGGNTVVGAQVNWQVTAGAVTLSNVIGLTDNNGDASALATLGNIGGTAQVTVTAGSASATFNLTVNIPSAGIQKVSGDQQTATINTAFTLPLTVEVVNSSGNGVAGAQVNFNVTSGSATLGSSSAITNSSGQASTTVTAGANAGSITITATTSTYTATFTLTAAPPGPSGITIVNGASFDPNTGISPGGIATIRGIGLLPGVQGLLTPTSGMPTTFSGVTVTFNGTPAPIYYVDHTSSGTDQVTVQVPFEVQPGAGVSLEIAVANEGSVTVQVPVLPLAPGVFTSVYSGQTYAVAVRPDGSQVSPTNPAQRGENIQIYVTGLGQATPAIATGAPGVANQNITSTLFVGLNNAGVPLISAVYAPGSVGVYVITMQVPEDTQTGPYQPVGVLVFDSANNSHYAQSTFIPIQ